MYLGFPINLLDQPSPSYPTLSYSKKTGTRKVTLWPEKQTKSAQKRYFWHNIRQVVQPHHHCCAHQLHLHSHQLQCSFWHNVWWVVHLHHHWRAHQKELHCSKHNTPLQTPFPRPHIWGFRGRTGEIFLFDYVICHGRCSVNFGTIFSKCVLHTIIDVPIKRNALIKAQHTHLNAFPSTTHLRF